MQLRDNVKKARRVTTPWPTQVRRQRHRSTPVLAESKAGPNEEKYIIIDPEDEDGGRCSSGKTLHGHQITLARGRFE